MSRTPARIESERRHGSTLPAASVLPPSPRLRRTSLQQRDSAAVARDDDTIVGNSPATSRVSHSSFTHHRLLTSLADGIRRRPFGLLENSRESRATRLAFLLTLKIGSQEMDEV